MRRLTTLTLLSACLLAALPAASAQEVSVPDNSTAKVFFRARAVQLYDAAKDETSVYMMAHWLTGPAANRPAFADIGLAAGTGSPMEGLHFGVYFTYPGKTYAAPRQIILRVASMKRGDRIFSDGDKLSVVADGQSLGVGDSVLTSEEFTAGSPKRGTEYVSEFLETPLSVEDFNRLVAAKKVELKAGAKSWKLGQTPLKALRRFAEAIGEAK
jgi:hypothetical protein